MLTFKRLPAMISLVMLVSIACALMPSAAQADPCITSNDPASLLQFTPVRHVPSLADRPLYLNGLDRALKIGPAASNLMQPASSGVSQNDARAPGAADYLWHTFYGQADSSYAESYGVAVDSAGNVYVTGYSDAAWNGPGDILPRHAFATNAANIVVIKLNSAGAYLWHTFYGAADSSATGNAIALDSAGNVYVTGYSYASWNGPGDTQPLNAYPGSGQSMFILKLNSAGAYQWHTFYGAADSYVAGTGIAVNSGSDVYVTGNSSADWNGPDDTLPLHAFAGNGDIVVVKLDSAGAYRWHTFYGDAEGLAAAVDSAGDVYVTGGSDDWNGPGDTPPLHAHSGNANNLVVIKLNGAGAYQWHTFYGTIVDSRGFGIAIGRAGDIYVAGYTAHAWNGPDNTQPLNAYQGSGNYNISIIKLNSAGAYRWHTFYGPSTLNDALARGITTDSAGSVYVTGYSDAAWNGPGGTPPLNPFAGNEDIVNLCLNSSGAYQWHTFYGPADSAALGYGIAADSAGNVYAAGDSYAAWNGPGGIPPLNPFAGGYLGITVVKMKANPAAPNVTSASVATSLGTVNFSINAGSINGLTNISPQDIPCQTPGYLLPYGMFSFTITNLTPGQTVSVSIRLPVSVPMGAKVFKCQNGSLTDFSQYTLQTDPNTFVITLRDGGQGDADGHANGTIVDPCGPAFLLNNAPKPSSAQMGAASQRPAAIANITVQSASLSAASVAPGAAVTVTAIASNRGNTDGAARIHLYVNGQEESSQGVSVASGASAPVQFTVLRNDPGTYSVYVGSVPAGTFTVDALVDPNIVLYLSCAALFIALIMGLYMLRGRNRR